MKQTSVRRRPFVAFFDSLEPRRLFALGIPGAAEASDRYGLTVSPSSGSTIAAGTPITALSTYIQNAATDTMTAPVPGKVSFGTFNISLPGGPADTLFFDWVHTGRALTSVRVDSSTAGGQIRESWKLGGALLTHFGQTTDGNGRRADSLTFIYTSITTTYHRYAADGSELTPVTVTTGVSGPGSSVLTTPYDTFFASTAPDVVETVELGSGELPVYGANVDFVDSASTPTTPQPAHNVGLTYGFVDGPESLTALSKVGAGQIIGNLIYTSRDPTTGQPAQRYRLTNAVMTTYGFTDSTLDEAPRAAYVQVVAAQYQLINYETHTDTPVASSTGWDYAHNAVWNNPTNAATVIGPANETRTTPLDSVSFRVSTGMIPSKSFFNYDNINPSLVSINSNADGTIWTVGNLAAAQINDGTYSVKLLADRVNDLSTANVSNVLFIGSAAKTWTLDRTTPSLVRASFAFSGTAAARYAFHYSLSEPIVAAAAADGTAPILIRRADTGQLVASPAAHLGTDGRSLDATLASTLADGRYTATLPAGSVRDAAGNLLGSDLVLPFSSSRATRTTTRRSTSATS